MPVKLRLVKRGTKTYPTWKVIAQHHEKMPRHRRLETLGSFDPNYTRQKFNILRLNVPRVQYWLAKGAEPSPAVNRLFAIADLMPRVVLRTKNYPAEEFKKLQFDFDWRTSFALDQFEQFGMQTTKESVYRKTSELLLETK
ncbi:MAG: hypothetical protein MHM6MM_004348 [Cercozoa sp. M6MM]